MKSISFAWLQKLPLLLVLISYIIGILIQTLILQLRFDDATILWILLAILFIISSFLLLKTKHRFYHFSYTLLLFLFVILGIFITSLSNPQSDKKWYGNHLENSSSFLVTLLESPQEKKRTYLLPVKVEAGLIDTVWHPLKGRLQVYVYKNDIIPQYPIGTQFIVPATLSPILHNNNPGAFDFAKKQKRDGLYYQMFLSQDQMVEVASKATSISWIANTRNHLLAQLDTFIQDPITKSLTQATLLNESKHMDAQMQIDYANTGISHIIAISGMHVNLLFGLLMLPFFWMKDKRKLWIKYLSVLPFVWIYVALCHYPPSAVRAAVGFTLITIAFILKRPQNNIHLLTINALLLLLINPQWLFHVGVQLSFLAVLSILIFYPVIRKWYSSQYTILNILWETVAVSLAVQILVFPLVIYYFHQFPLWFLVANFFAAIFSLVQMSLAFLIMLFGVFHFHLLASKLALILEWITTVFNQFIAWLNKISPDLSRMIPLDELDYFLLMMSIILLSIFWLRKQLWALYLGLSLVFVFSLNIFLLYYKASSQEKIIVYAGVRQSAIEHIKGRASILYTDSLSENIIQYVAKPARLKYRVGQYKEVKATNNYWQVGQKKIVFLNNDSFLPSQKIDILILNKNVKLSVEEIMQTMQAQWVILDASWSRSAAIRYSLALRERGLKVHNTQIDGAWWYYAK